MLVEWIYEQEELKGELSAFVPMLDKVLDAVLVQEGIEMDVMLGARFVSGERICEINKAFRNVDSVTDVLSFPLVEGRLCKATRAQLLGCMDPQTGAIEIGDLVLCYTRAQEQAQEYGHSVMRELGYLAAHGLLHLLGHDHEDEAQRIAMRVREEAALSQCGLTRE